ncbi:siderophore-interacting protein [Actinopolyspora saharensis]|uniref:NADPH-dependent ferric siderophore reductase, contains FAD-binding and SIP domains n=1 Tax=Actinopolyspora saharensis TaxID=995062 RepID=A0A1H1G271_9ACTN|nr:siderophore-interacting protein [Actinopolyspora saharensis]SDR06978.1 NADPH-dependent ferric siderophore reductase, contains FAD-binding and SIP domains [Actinopolyspora saharensis]
MTAALEHTARRNEQKPEYRVYTVEVVARKRLSPSFVRVTVAGECLRSFGAGGADQRIKLMLPQPGRTVADVPQGRDWYAEWQAMPEETRPTMRTYTVRAFRPSRAEIDIDFVLHGSEVDSGGPASNWAASTRPGDRVALLGPDRPGTGRMWGCEWCPPATARRLLLAGDETAIPAVGAILESLPASACGIACLEIPTEDDVQEWEVPSGMEVRWLPRKVGTVRQHHGSLLEGALSEALRELCGGNAEPEQLTSSPSASLEDVDVDSCPLWEVPEAPARERVDVESGELYGWLAGEAGVIKRLRRMTVNQYGVPRTSVAFMGYWREGRH